MGITVKAPSVKAPTLTQEQQRINIPTGAFGQREAQALSGLGAQVEQGSAQLNEALFRFNERKSHAKAVEASKNVPVSMWQALEAQKQAAIKDPALLDDFPNAYINSYDGAMETLTKDMDERTKVKFLSMTNGTRASYSKNAATWTNVQVLKNGVAATETTLNGYASAAAANPMQIQDYYALSSFALKDAFANGFRTGDFDTEEASEHRKISMTVANSMLKDSPLQLLQMLDAGLLLDLNGKDKNKLKNQATNSLKRIDEQAEVTKFVQETSKNIELSERIDKGTVGINEIETSGLSQESIDFYKRRVLNAEKSRGEKIEDAVEKAIVLDARNRVLERLGIKERKQPKPSVIEKDTVSDKLNEEFERIANVNKEGDVKSIDILNDALRFISNVYDAQEAGLITNKNRKDYIEKLLPSLIEKIDSKYFEGKATGIKAFFGFPRPANVYADHYNSVLAMLEKTTFNTETNRVLAMANVIEQVDIVKSADEKDREELERNIASNAMNELIVELNPELGLREELPDISLKTLPAQSTRVPQTAIEFLRNAPTQENIKFFNETFGKDAANAFIK